MFTAMESFTEYQRNYQRAVRVKPFSTLEKAIGHCKKKAKGKPFVMVGQRVVWTPSQGVAA